MWLARGGRGYALPRGRRRLCSAVVWLVLRLPGCALSVGRPSGRPKRQRRRCRLCSSSSIGLRQPWCCSTGGAFGLPEQAQLKRRASSGLFKSRPGCRNTGRLRRNWRRSCCVHRCCHGGPPARRTRQVQAFPKDRRLRLGASGHRRMEETLAHGMQRIGRPSVTAPATNMHVLSMGLPCWTSSRGVQPHMRRSCAPARKAHCSRPGRRISSASRHATS
mmetsp:Transcript_46930/g.102013  ORF Transcript_46930/g.102013 Transcript_46930/m.102013 type:complete len:219 (+) Transcript_46930:2412-3068(+)